MTTYKDFTNIRRLEEITKQTGFDFGPSTFSSYGDRNEQFGLWATEKLPIFAPDSQLVTGTAEELIYFMLGWQKSLEYLSILGATDTKKIDRKAKDYINKKLLKKIKETGNKEVEEV
jgi:hypothetical protein